VRHATFIVKTINDTKTHMGVKARFRRQKLFAVFLLLGVFSASFFYANTPAHAAAGINTQMNFQGRLLNAQGAVVPDGFYNIQFKIYQDGDGLTAGDTTGTPAGTLKWTESRLNNLGQGVLVQNGYLSVQLGSVTPFGASVDFNQDSLWLSMNIAGTSTTCTTFATCSPDGEMTPMKRLSSTAYALNTKLFGGLTTSQFLQLGQGVQADASSTSSVFINKTNSGNLIQLQSSGINAFTIGNAGDLTFGANANHTLAVAPAGAGVVGKSLTIAGGTAGSGASALVGGDLVLQGGAGGGSNGNGGNLQLDAGLRNGTGADGSIKIGTVAASTVQIGATTLATNQTINIGNNNTASSTTTVTIGSVVGSSSTNLQGGTGGINLTGVVSGSSTINAATGFKFNGTAGASTTCNAGEYLQQQVVMGGLTTGGTCTAVSAGSASSTLQDVYNNSNTTPAITFNSTGKGIAFRDASAPVGGNLFAVQNNAASTNYFAVTSSGASVAGTMNVSTTLAAGVSITAPSIDVATAGGLNIGTTTATTIQVGSNTLASGTQTINIGNNNTAGGTTNVTIGAGGSATGGTTTIQAKGTVSINTNGIARATFDTSNILYLGNGVSASAPSNYAISGTASTAAGTAGAQLAIQGGNATTGNTGGGNLLLSGGTASGTGANGLVVLTTPTFSATTNDPNCFPLALAPNGANADCTIAQASVNNSSTIIVGFAQQGKTATLPNPTLNTIGRVVYISASSLSKDFTLAINGGGTGNQVAMRANTSATMIWNGSAWTAAGASSSTTLQAAYDNTLQGAGGAELIVSKTANTNGLTIRDSSTNPVDGALLTVQSSSASTVISINSNVTEYSSNSGAETPGSISTPTTFPAGTWSALSGSTSLSRYTTVGDYIATGQASVAVTTGSVANDGIKNTLNSALSPNMHYNVSFAARQSSNTIPFTDMNVYYSVDGSSTPGSLILCTTGQIVNYSIWTKVNCAFTAPSAGISASNAILIRQTSGVTHNFYVDNLSVTISADYNYATDPGVDDQTNMTTNWSAVGGATVTRSTSFGNDTSDSAQATTTGASQGVRNKLSIKPLASTLYRVSVYVGASAAGLNNFNIKYSWDAGGHQVPCADYNTQAVSNLSVSGAKFTQITCYIKTDANLVTSPYVYFTQDASDSTARTFYVDTFSMTLASPTTPNVQIGGGSNGGPVSLLTLDRAASAPIASNNDAFLGSMYYDTTLGKLQCYEADGWGACGSSPDVVVTISPEYTNAVMHGTGVGTMTSDICSDSLDINDVQNPPVICNTNETYNFYKWTSPQANDQTYSIYVSYQLPDTFKQFASGQTSVTGRTDSTNATVQYSIYRSDASGLTACGGTKAVSTGASTAWNKVQADGAIDPSTCGFAAGSSILFKIDMKAKQNASAYVSNLNFTYSNR
jgi:hypothetical protein